MQQPQTALTGIQALLGYDALDSNVWEDFQRFKAVAIDLIQRIWQLDQIDDSEMFAWQIVHSYTDLKNSENAERLEFAVAEIQAVIGVDTAHYAANCILHPHFCTEGYLSSRSHDLGVPSVRITRDLLRLLLETCLLRQTPADWDTRLAQRLVSLTAATMSSYWPFIEWCISQMIRNEQQDRNAFLDALTNSDFAQAWECLQTLSGWQVEQDHQAFYELWKKSGHYIISELLRRAAQRGCLNSQVLRQLLDNTPHAFRVINSWSSPQYQANLDTQEHAWLEQVTALLDGVIWEMVSDFRPESWDTLLELSVLRGGHYLLHLAEEVQRQGITSLKGKEFYGYSTTHSDQILRKLLRILVRRPDDDSSALTGLLRQIEPTTLLIMLPHVPSYEREICDALAWPGLYEMFLLFKRLEEASLHNSNDPSAGVFHAQEIRDRAAGMHESHLTTLLDTLDYYTHPILLIRAALGLNRSEVRRLFGRRNPVAARAMGLLPLIKPDELIERFLKLSRYYQEANKTRVNRKNSERAAARAGLSNLALQAGYSDSVRLEWAMQAQLEEKGIAIGRVWQIEGYRLTLILSQGEPKLEIHNGKRVLKRTPSLLSRDYAYREVRETLEMAQNQARRFNHAFLEAMRSDQLLSPEEIVLLRRNPLAIDQLERLVLIDEAGSCGLFRAEDCSLEGTLGERVLVQGALQIAHPYHLAQRGDLEVWQREIVRREIVQPFKQVFRELYLLTPAEAAVPYASARLADRRLKSQQAVAIMTNLGWINYGYRFQKSFYQYGFVASFDARAVFHYDHEENEAATTGDLSFWPLQIEANQSEQRIKLSDIPALIFSEVMRDLDLVTVIAHQSEEDATSREVIQRRSELVQATVSALGLGQVKIEAPYVYVDGKLSSYRIHLATAAIYLQSGQYLCIVPSSKEQKAVFVPYAEQGEQICSEIISKILLLAQDNKIKDASILSQIGQDRTVSLNPSSL